jgi:DNA-binding NarL/FixJ family response regulator
VPPAFTAAVVRVVIAADIRLYREGLALALGGRGGFAVAGFASRAADAVAAVRDLRPDVALIDLAMPESLGVIRALAEAAPGVKVVALAVPEVDLSVLACAEAGVAGYVPRDGSLEDLVQAIESAARDELHCSPRIAASLFRHVAALSADRARAADERAPLTTREVEIVRLIDRGLANKEIARTLCIEVATVKNHVHNILEKLQVSRRGEAAARVRLEGERSHPLSPGRERAGREAPAR